MTEFAGWHFRLMKETNGMVGTFCTVNEAKGRGLTPEACAKLLGGQAIQVKEAPPKEGNI